MDQAVVDYIKKSRGAGRSDADTRSVLLGAGHNAADVDSAFNSASGEPAPQKASAANSSPTSPSVETRSPGFGGPNSPPLRMKGNLWMIAAIMFLAGVLIGASVMYYYAMRKVTTVVNVQPQVNSPISTSPNDQSTNSATPPSPVPTGSTVTVPTSDSITEIKAVLGKIDQVKSIKDFLPLLSQSSQQIATQAQFTATPQLSFESGTVNAAGDEAQIKVMTPAAGSGTIASEETLIFVLEGGQWKLDLPKTMEYLSTNPGAVSGTQDPETLAEERDGQRISDLDTVRTAINIYLSQTQGTPNIDLQKSPGGICSSKPGSGQTPFAGGNCRVVTSTAMDGTGWVDINFNNLPGGSPMSKLPLDPVNNGIYFYSYKGINTSGTPNYTFKLVTRLESTKFRTKMIDTSTGKSCITYTEPTCWYEVGTNINL